jgi:hypothetical protein
MIRDLDKTWMGSSNLTSITIIDLLHDDCIDSDLDLTGVHGEGLENDSVASSPKD